MTGIIVNLVYALNAFINGHKNLHWAKNGLTNKQTAFKQAKNNRKKSVEKTKQTRQMKIDLMSNTKYWSKELQPKINIDPLKGYEIGNIRALDHYSNSYKGSTQDKDAHSRSRCIDDDIPF